MSALSEQDIRALCDGDLHVKLDALSDDLTGNYRPSLRDKFTWVELLNAAPTTTRPPTETPTLAQTTVD